MRRAIRELLFSRTELNPARLDGLALWLDAIDQNSLLASDGSVIEDGEAVALVSDKSGNSTENCLVLNGATGNSALLGAIGAVGTGDFTAVATVAVDAFGGATDIVLFTLGNGIGAAALVVKNGTSRVQMSKSGTGYVSATNGTNLSAFTTYTITYTRSGTTGTYYINGVADGTATDNFDYTGNAGAGVGANTSGVGHKTFKIRAYSTALSAAEVLADYNGTVQDNCTVNVDFTAQSKLATSFTATVGGTVTINSTGATGARISGARDPYQGTVANRPVYLKYNGENYGYLNGAAGNYFSTPDSAAADITSDIEIIFKATSTDWTGINQTIAAKRTSGDGLSWQLLTGINAFQFSLKVGATELFNDSTLTPPAPLTANTYYWFKFNRVAATGAVSLYSVADQSTQPTSWGTAWTASGTRTSGDMIANNAEVSIGANRLGVANVWSGRIAYLSIANTIGGNPVISFDASRYTSGTTFTASTGETWTLNGGAHIVTRTGLYFDGVNDYLKTAPFSLSQPESVYFTGNQVGWTVGDKIYDGSGASNRGALYQTSVSPIVGLFAGSAAAAANTWPVKTFGAIGAIFNGASSLWRYNRAAATAGSVGANAMNGFTLGSEYGGTTEFGNIVVSEVAIYSAAHDTATQDRLVLYAGRKWRFTV